MYVAVTATFALLPEIGPLLRPIRPPTNERPVTLTGHLAIINRGLVETDQRPYHVVPRDVHARQLHIADRTLALQ